MRGLTRNTNSLPAEAAQIVADNKKEESDIPLSIFLGTLQTRAEEQALGFAVDYGKSLAERANEALGQSQTFENWDYPSFFLLSPDISIKSGDKDSFSGILAKIQANLVVFPKFTLVNVPGVERPIQMPDPDGIFHVFTASGGVETDGSFETVDGLIEAGWEPGWDISSEGWKIYPGLFLQTGFKFNKNDTGSGLINGNTPGDVDQSEEDAGDVLGRAKISLEMSSPTWPVLNNTFNMSILASGAVWYDVINDSVYHNVNGIVRLSVSKDKHFDLKYEHGSGAPNFNEGDQFSTGLTIDF